MPRSAQAVMSFSAGVLSPAMEMRADSDRFARACKSLKNWLVTPQGGVTMRQGSEFIGNVKDPANPPRIFTHHNGGDVSDILLEMGAGTTRYWQDDALITKTAGPIQESSNPYSQSELQDVHVVNEEQIVVSVHGDHPPQYTTIKNRDDIVTQAFPFTLVPMQRFNDTQSSIGVPGATSYLAEFTGTWTDGDIFNFTYDGKQNTSVYWGGATIPTRYTFSSTPADMLVELQKCIDESPALKLLISSSVTDEPGTDTYGIALNGTQAGRVMQMDPDAQWGPANGFINVNYASGVIGTPNLAEEPAWSFPFVVLHGGTYYQVDVAHKGAADNEPGVGANWADVWQALPGKPSWFDYQWPAGNSWAIDLFYAPWDRGWPRTLAFHEQRLFFGGSKSAPTHIWGSAIAQYDFFSLGPGDNDAVSFALATTGTPAIQWLSSLQGLVAGTTSGIFRIGADVTISPSDIAVQKHTASRSANIKSRSIGTSIVFVQLGNTKVLSTEYQRDRLALTSTDMTLMAQHLFDAGVLDIEVMLTPETVLLCTRADGELSLLSFNQEGGVTAWSEWGTKGNFIDSSSVFDLTANEEQFYFCVERKGVYAIEKIPYPERKLAGLANLEGLVYFDAHYSGTLAPGSTQITGIPSRLAGDLVGVTVNDAFEGEFTVSGGSITLPGIREGYFSLGLRYLASGQTFERPDGNPAGIGFSAARRWNKLYTRLVDSALPIVNGQRTADRTPASPMNLPEGLRSGDVRTHNLGYDDGSITFVQDLPFPTHIAGFFGQIGVSDA